MIRLILVLAVLAGSGFYFGIFDFSNESEGVETELEKPLEDVLIEAIIAKNVMSEQSLNTQVIGRYKKLDDDVVAYYKQSGDKLRKVTEIKISSYERELMNAKVKLNDCSANCSDLESKVESIEVEIESLNSDMEEKLSLLSVNENKKREELRGDYMDKLNKLVLGDKNDG